MASQFSIVAADITPDPIPTAEYRQLLRNPTSGAEDIAIADVIVAGENECLSYAGGMFTLAANKTLAKPQVIAVIAYRLHARRASNADYKIPDVVKTAYDKGIEWFRTIGARLLSAEGVTQPAGTGHVEYTAPTAEHTMTKLDYL